MASHTRTPVVAYLYADEGPAQPQLARILFRAARTTIALSRYGRELAISLGAPSGRVTVIEPGVDPPAQPRTPRSDDPLIVTVSRLADRYKGHDVILDALPMIRERIPTARWIVVGDGPLRAQLEGDASALGVSARTFFVGSLSEDALAGWYQACDVLALPSTTRWLRC